MITKVFAICLLVENLKTSREFYENKLRLVVNSEDIGFVDYKLGETPLALFEKKHAIAMFKNKYMYKPGGAVIALSVEDMEQVIQALKDKDIEIFEGPKQTSWGQTVVYVHDPDGHIIELTN